GDNRNDDQDFNKGETLLPAKFARKSLFHNRNGVEDDRPLLFSYKISITYALFEPPVYAVDIGFFLLFSRGTRSCATAQAARSRRLSGFESLLKIKEKIPA